MADELVERLLDGELQQLREDLLPYKDKSIGWLRIDMGEVRKIIAAVEAFTEAATTITRLTAEVAAQARVLRDVAALPLIPEMAKEPETLWGILTLEERCDMIARNRERHDAAILAARALTGGPHDT